MKNPETTARVQEIRDRLVYCADSPCVDEPTLRDLLREAASVLDASQARAAALAQELREMKANGLPVCQGADTDTMPPELGGQ
jgi:hypothetical protein